ncbi:DNA double-strand break repair nuclease NurA, partial [Methylicorpusculum sp.]|uniref:DNA double-strand break repair nuclease NurA n=1 Tax=Methylicorpusculum sp. TaxID=2713644 RepID=UPI002AB8B23D
KISQDASFIYTVRAAQATTPLLLPTWDPEQHIAYASPIGVAPDRGAAVSASVHEQPAAADQLCYRVISVDGSQIYPDRHQGSSCFLINVGMVMLAYGLAGKGADLSCWPTVYSGQEMTDAFVSTEVINGQRQEAELQEGFRLCAAYAHDGAPQLLLFDGSLVFWHLEAQDTRLRDRFLPAYLASVQQLYEARDLVAGYISAPRSRELVNLIKLALIKEGKESEAEAVRLVDAHVAHFFLTPGTRSIVFKNHASICEQYAEHLQPHFFYVHVGDEIGRVEIPAWIAADERLVTFVAQVIFDQCKKGYGYPVAIAEAHEQAVVKGADRDFFYQALNRLSIAHKQRMLGSQKSMKKRRASF